MRRLDIQGLRALAVALVVAFHLIPKTLTGGYVGLDVFFVISGYLITQQLVKEATTTRGIKLGRFWARRIRRLLPAAFLVLVVSAVGSYFFLPQSLLSQNLNEIFFAAIYIVNWTLAANAVDYMASENVASIAQHYWSLSVEEQFYIFWPILIIVALWVATKIRWLRIKPAILTIIATVFVASLAFSIYETALSQPSAYFMTTTRAWEFAAGGLVALAPVFALRGRSHALISWGSLGVILATALLFDSSTPFPGWVALIPVAATAALLWVGDSSSTWSPQFLSHSGPIQFIGDLSYGIYLWHWPLIIFATSELGRSLGWDWGLILAVATVALAWGSKRFVEDPIRFGSGIFSRTRPAFAGMAIGIAVIASITGVPTFVMKENVRLKAEELSAVTENPANCLGAGAIVNACSSDEIPQGFVDPQAASQDNWRLYSSERLSEFCEVATIAGAKLAGDYPAWECLIGSDQNKTVIVGDSHAGHYLPPLAQLALEGKFSLEALIKPGCSPFAASQDPKQAPCVEWKLATWEKILEDENVDLVILSMLTFISPVNDRTREEARDVITQLKNQGKKVILIRDNPTTRPQPDGTSPTGAECVERGLDCSWTPNESNPDWLLSIATDLEIPVIDTWKILCPDGICEPQIGGLIVYRDKNHLTVNFSLTMKTWLNGELATIAPKLVIYDGSTSQSGPLIETAGEALL